MVSVSNIISGDYHLHPINRIHGTAVVRYTVERDGRRYSVELRKTVRNTAKWWGEHGTNIQNNPHGTRMKIALDFENGINISRFNQVSRTDVGAAAPSPMQQLQNQIQTLYTQIHTQSITNGQLSQQVAVLNGSLNVKTAQEKALVAQIQSLEATVRRLQPQVATIPTLQATVNQQAVAITELKNEVRTLRETIQELLNAVT